MKIFLLKMINKILSLIFVFITTIISFINDMEFNYVKLVQVDYDDEKEDKSYG